MAPKTTPKTMPPPADQAPPAPEPPDQPQAPEWSWDQLADSVAMPEKVAFTGVKANVLSTVPEPIRIRAEASLAINAARVAAKADSNAKRSRVNYHWSLQLVPTSALGEEFKKAVIKYAKYRPTPAAEHTAECQTHALGLEQACNCPATIPHAAANSPAGQVTARCGDVGHYRKEEDGTYVATDPTTTGAVLGVRYSVRPFEQRSDTARVPGTE